MFFFSLKSLKKQVLQMLKPYSALKEKMYKIYIFVSKSVSKHILQLD